MDPTEEELLALLADYRAAESAAAKGSSYTIDGITLTRQDLPYIRHAITNIRRQLIDLDVSAAGGTQGQRIPVWN